MLPHQIQIIQTSWARLAPTASQAAGLFYQRLFEIDPALKPLFKGDINEQGKKLMHAINLVVGSLTKLDSLLPTLRLLGQRHESYGVQAHHYDTVGAALLWTLEQGLGADFTPETRDAWSQAYGAIAAAMQGGSELNQQAA